MVHRRGHRGTEFSTAEDAEEETSGAWSLRPPK